MATGLGFKLAVGALIAMGLGGSKKKGQGGGGALTRAGEQSLGQGVAANLKIVPNSTTMDAFTSVLAKLTSNPITDISLGASAITSAIANPIAAAVALLVVEVAFSIFLVVNYFKSEQDMLNKGQAGALLDMQHLAQNVSGTVQTLLTGAGVNPSDALQVGNLYGFLLASYYNSAPLNYLLYIALRSNADPLECPRRDYGGMDAYLYWSDRGVLYYQPGVTNDQLYSVIFGVPAGTLAVDQAKAPQVITNWTDLVEQAKFIGEAAWCSVAMLKRWDCNSPLTFGPWISPIGGKSGEQYFADFYAAAGCISGAYNDTTKQFLDTGGSGLIWDVGKTWSSGKPVIVAPGS